MLKKPTNTGLKKLPPKVRNRMGYAAKGGQVETKLKEITGALKKASKMHAAHAKYLSGLMKKIK